MNTNKLQFLHHSSPFQTVEEAKGYVLNLIENGSLRIAIGEPFVLVYGQTDDLNALIGVGTKENGTGVFFIDQDADVESIRRMKTILANVVTSCGFDEDGKLKAFSSEIVSGSSNVEDAIEELASYAKAQTLKVSDTRTVDLTLENRGSETELTADVKVPDNIILNNNTLANTLQVGDDGLYVYVDIAHTLGTNKFKMFINDQVKEIDLEDTVKSGVYDNASRSIILTLNNNNKVYIDLQEVFANFKASDIVCWLPSGEKTNLQSVVSSGGVVSNFESGNETNIIRSVGGLFASVNLTYNALTNTLVFTKSDNDEGSKTTEIQLNSANVLDHIYYDRSTEELVLIYHTTDGQRQEVRIPVSDLFEEWYTDNSNSTVTLTKDRSIPGYTSLKGNVNVAPLSLVPHNILQEFHNAGFHGLSVNGVAENIAYGNGTVKDALDSMGVDLSAEIAARISGDNANAQAIANEERRARNREDELSRLISAETAARTSADNALRTDLNAEINARAQADSGLNAAIVTEINDREREISRLDNALSAETTARENTDADLLRLIQAETTARENADTTLSGAIQTEISERKEAVQAEVSARTEADNALSGAIQTEISERQSDVSALSAAIDTEVAAREAAIRAEISARTEADNALSGAIETEIIERKDAIQAEVSARTEAINIESHERAAADADLDRRISAETAERESADTELWDAINEEISARTDADDALWDALSAETIDRQSADSALSGAIDTESATRASNDAVLSGAIGTVSGRVDVAFDKIVDVSSKVDSASLQVSGNNAINAWVEEDNRNPLVNTLYIENNINTENRNIINVEDDGLFAFVGLDYDETTNTLMFVNSGDGSKDIHLMGGSLINDIYYDSSANTLVIEYDVTTSSGTSVQTASIPVSDFFKPMVPDNHNHTATVTTGTTASGNQTVGVDVNIYNNANNILETRYSSDRSAGYLFVDGTPIQTISGNLQSVVESVSVLEGQVATVSGALDGKQDTLSAGTGLDITNNVISLTAQTGGNYSGASGVTLERDGVTFRGVVARGSEPFLKVDSDGFSLSGVGDAIDTAKDEAIASATQYADDAVLDAMQNNNFAHLDRTNRLASGEEQIVVMDWVDTSRISPTSGTVYATNTKQIETYSRNTLIDSKTPSKYVVYLKTNDNTFWRWQNDDMVLVQNGSYSSGQVDTLLDEKQDTLSAGTGLDITNGVITLTAQTGGNYVGASGVTLEQDGITFRGVIDTANTESYLGLGANGFYVAGISGAIEDAVTSAKNYTDSAITNGDFAHLNKVGSLALGEEQKLVLPWVDSRSVPTSGTVYNTETEQIETYSRGEKIFTESPSENVVYCRISDNTLWRWNGSGMVQISVGTGGTDVHVSGVTVVTVSGGVDSEGASTQVSNGVYLKTVFEGSNNKIYTPLSGVVTFQNSESITFSVDSGNVVTAEVGVNGVLDCGDYYTTFNPSAEQGQPITGSPTQHTGATEVTGTTGEYEYTGATPFNP